MGPFYVCKAAGDLISEAQNRKIRNSGSSYFARIHAKKVAKLYVALLNTQHAFCAKIITEVSPHVRVNIALLGFLAYRFMNRQVKWWLDASAWQHSKCREVVLS